MLWWGFEPHIINTTELSFFDLMFFLIELTCYVFHSQKEIVIKIKIRGEG